MSTAALARALGAAGATLAVWACLAQAALAEACPGSGSGQCPYVSTRSIGQRAEGVLRFPEAVALDPAAAAGSSQGYVYVADQLGYVIQKFTLAGAFVGEWGAYGGGHGQFGPVGGLAVDGAGDVYVVDSAHDRIEKFDANGGFITAWGHTGSEVGQFRFFSSQNPSQPPGGGIAVAGSYVYVADSGNNRIERFNLQGGEALAWGTRGSEPGQFSYPRGVAANAGEVLVADDDNHRIEKFDPNGAFQATAGTHGTGAGQFGFPYGVALDAAGNAYVADDINHRVVKLTPELGYLSAWGGFGSLLGQLAFPRALAVDGAGDSYVTDTANDRIQVFGPEGALLRAFGTSARLPGVLTAPRGVAGDPLGGLFVSDAPENRIERFAPASDAFAGIWPGEVSAAGGLREPSGIAVDRRGPVYVADTGNARVLAFWGDGTLLSEIGGHAMLGGAELSGAKAVASASESGWVYVADTAHNRVLAYGPEGTLRARIGAGGGDGSAGAGAGQFNRPMGVAVGRAGDVYVADQENNRIVRLSPEGGVIAQWGSLGAGDGRFHSPSAVATDGGGRVFVLDSTNNRVEVFDAEGRFLAKWGLRGVGEGEFSRPTAIAVGCAGEVYVADTNSNRVERFDLASPAPAGCLGAGAWPPPLDVAPVLHVSMPRRSGVLARRALALLVSCQRGCRVLAAATLYAHGRRGARLIGTVRSLPAAQAGYVRVRIGSLTLHRLRAALGRRMRMTASVRVVAVGPTGRRTTITRTYAVRR